MGRFIPPLQRHAGGCVFFVVKPRSPMRLLHPLLVLAFLWTASTSARAQVPPSIIVTVDYQARPGQGDALHAALGPLLAEVRKEPHFAGITVLRDPQGDPDRILLVEQWTDRAYYTGA